MPRPPPSRQLHPLGDVLIFSPPGPPPAPLSGKALATKIALCAPGTGSCATQFESERRRRLAPTMSVQGLAAWAPATRLRRARVSLPAEGSAVCVSMSVSVSVSLSARVCRV